MKKMVSGESESVSAKEKRVIMKELVKGQEAATQLKVLLHNPFGTQPSLSSRQLMENVLRSFTHALSVINSSPSEPASAHELAHRNLCNSSENGSPVAGSGKDLTLGDCSESIKRSQKGGRDCYSTRDDKISLERSNKEMQYRGNDNLYKQF